MSFSPLSRGIGVRAIQSAAKCVTVSGSCSSSTIHRPFSTRRGVMNGMIIRTATYHNHIDFNSTMREIRKGMKRSYSVGDAKNVTCEKCSHVYNIATDDNDGIVFKLVKEVSCPICGALQNINDLPNYFEILGQNHHSYRVDIQGMSNRAKQLQKKFHPDLYSQKGNDQQQLSQEYSSLINKALYTLSDPISRGRYMLTLFGLSLESEGDLEKNITKNPEFLEEVMELNEKLEEINSENSWKEFRNQNVETMKQIQLDLEKAFEKKDVQEAQRLLGRLKYYDTMQHKLKELQSKIGFVE